LWSENIKLRRAEKILLTYVQQIGKCNFSYSHIVNITKYRPQSTITVKVMYLMCWFDKKRSLNKGLS